MKAEEGLTIRVEFLHMDAWDLIARFKWVEDARTFVNAVPSSSHKLRIIVEEQ